MAKFNLRLIQSADFGAISEIWHETLPDDIFSLLGKSFIAEKYLPLWQGHRGAFGVLAESEGGNAAVGFVLFAESSHLLRQMVQRHFLLLISGITRSLILRPLVTAKVILSVIRFMLCKSKTKTLPEYYELNYIGVLPSYRNLRVGSDLVNFAFCEMDGRKEFQNVYVKTLLATPATHAFYSRLGFEKYEQISGRVIFIHSILS
jgi:ribosomal protein S18 acetylase RimI-like enzyme